MTLCRIISTALLCLTLAVSACAIRLPDLVIKASASPLGRDGSSSELRVTADHHVVIYEIVPNGKLVNVRKPGFHFIGVVSTPGDQGIAKLRGEIVLTDVGPNAADPPQTLRIEIDQLVEKGSSFTKVAPGWTAARSRNELRISFEP